MMHHDRHVNKPSLQYAVVDESMKVWYQIVPVGTVSARLLDSLICR